MALVYDKQNIKSWLACYQVLIAADTDTTLLVPANTKMALVTSEHQLWVDDVAITLPSSSSFAVTTCLKNPMQFYVTPGTTLHFRSRLEQDVYVQFYN